MKTTLAVLMLSTSLNSLAQAQARPQTPPAPTVATTSAPAAPADASTLRTSPSTAMTAAKPNLVESVLARDSSRDVQRAARGGTAIGGGTVYEGLISWCNEAIGILHDSLVAAREAWGLSGQAAEALNLYVDGLEQAQRTAQEVQTVAQTFTLRYVNRGITLSQILGADSIIAGQTLPDSSTRDLVTFFDWYIANTKRMGEELDRAINIPYVSSRSCRGAQCRDIPSVSVASLEDKVVEMTIGVLRNLQNRFVRQLPDRSNYYASISVPNYLRAQSYMLRETAADLRLSLYAESFACQAARMDQLAEQMQRYLNTRRGNSLDAIRLNQFTVTQIDILRKLEHGGCR